MTTTTLVARFENIAPRDGEELVPSPYKRLDWHGVLAAGDQSEGGAEGPNGYTAVMHGHAFAYNAYGGPCSFSAQGDSLFTLKSGHFAAAWNVGLKVKFKAFHDGIQVAHKTVTLDQTDSFVTFGPKFHNVDKIVITSHGGTHGEGLGHGTQVAFDNLTLVFNDAAHARHHDGAADAAGAAVHHDALHHDILLHGVGDTWLL